MPVQDAVILRRISEKSDKKLLDETVRHLTDFAKLGEHRLPMCKDYPKHCSGYRTLCVAKREISEDEYLAWVPGYYEASCAMEKRQELVAQQAELIEKVALRAINVCTPDI